jgi:hypothetical protein
LGTPLLAVKKWILHRAEAERLREIPCFASSPHDEFAGSWFHRRLLRDSQSAVAARHQIAIVSMIFLTPGGMCCISTLRHGAELGR